jgi:hypothetical protein
MNTLVHFYVAGSYTAPTEAGILMNIKAAILGALDVMLARGWHPVVPHTSQPPHVSWDEAMDYCRAIIRKLSPARDFLVVLPGWEASRGAREEVQLAMDLGIRVLKLEDVLSGRGGE